MRDRHLHPVGSRRVRVRQLELTSKEHDLLLSRREVHVESMKGCRGDADADGGFCSLGWWGDSWSTIDILTVPKPGGNRCCDRCARI